MRTLPRELILDANLLVLLVVGSIDLPYVPAFRRTRAYTAEDFHRVADFARQFRTLIVTPHILTEVTNLLDDLEGSRRTAAFASLRRLIGESDERFEPSRDIAAGDLFVRLGLADAAVHSITASGAALLTVDLELYLAAAEVNQQYAINYNHFRAGAWDL